DQLADRLGCPEIAARLQLAFQARVHRRCRRERPPVGVIDDLRVDMLQTSKHRQARPLRRARHPPAQPVVPAPAQLVLLVHRYLPFPPLAVLPALRRTCSPWYRIPLPLYGSGFFTARISAACCPTSSLSMPVIRTKKLRVFVSCPTS